METETRRRVLLIGWDAADWKTITPLLDAGKMPNLAGLVEGGVCGNLATLQPVLSPMLWTSIATGKRAYKHGICGFTEPDPVTGGIRPVTNLSRKTKAIWNILNQNDLRTATIGWWPSHPAEELSRGIMVSNDYQRAPSNDPADWPLKPGTIHPRKLEEMLAARRVHPATLTEPEIRAFLPALDGMTREELDRAAKEPRLQSLLKIIADCTSIHSAASLLMNAPWDFMGVYYDAIDHFGHAFMKFHPPRREHVDEWEFRLFSYCLEAGYLLHDRMLGELLALAGPETTVIVMSDHGFHPDHLRPRSIPREPAGPAVEHRQFGIFAASGPGLRRDERVYGANILDICPTILHLFGLPVGEDMDGKVLLDIYEAEPAPLVRVASWDAVPGDHGMHPPDRQISAADSKAALDQLVALGYIEKPDEDAGRAIEHTVRELDYNLALARLDGGLYREAIQDLERLYEAWPMQHRFGFHLAVGYQRTGRTVDLRRIVSIIVERRLEEAKSAEEELQNLPTPAESLTEPQARRRDRHVRNLLAKSRPNLSSLRYLEACAEFSEKRYEEALSRLEDLDQDYGARQKIHILRGEVLQQMRRWPESRAAFEEALAIDPETPAALIGLARTDLAEHKFADAAEHARRSVGLLFFQPRAHYLHGLALHRLGNWEEAEYAFTICITQAPLFAAAHRMIAEIARRHRRDPALSASLRARFKQVMEQRRTIRAGQNISHRESSGLEAETTTMEETWAAETNVPVDWKAADIITVVTGMPRSGTSLMMQLLEAAGLSIFTDGEREADDSNQRGYYEHRRIASLLHSHDLSWFAEARGRAVKVVAPLLSSLPRQLLVAGSENAVPVPYRVLFMERDMDEVLASQSSFIRRLGQDAPAEQGGDVAKAYRQQLRNARDWCRDEKVRVLPVSYSALVTSPDEMLPKLAAFLGAPDRVDAMRACIDPSLYRERRS